MIPLLEPHLGGNEARYVKECLDSGYVSSVGPFVERFEREFAAYVGSRHAVACASGTAALHVALRLAGAGRGSLVAVSDFTFIASANAITYTGAEPLLVDSEPCTWNMDGELLHAEVIRRARQGEQIPGIIEIVHSLGHPAEIEQHFGDGIDFGRRIHYYLREPADMPLGSGGSLSLLTASGHCPSSRCSSLTGDLLTHQGLRVGAGATVGEGAVVAQDVPPGVTVVGVPAKLLERR